MVSKKQRMLVITARGDELACLFFNGKDLIDRHASRKAATTVEEAVIKVKSWLQMYRPDVVVSENLDTAQRKGERNRGIIKAVGAVFEDCKAFNIQVARQQNYKNIYLEAAALSELYPKLKPRCPKQPEIWEGEHRQVIYFEALSMALQVLEPVEKI